MEIFKLRSNFLNSYRFIQMFHFIWISCDNSRVLFFWGIGSFHLNCPIYACKVVPSISIVFSWCFSYIPCFIANIGIWCILFFIMNLARYLSILVIFSKNQLCVLLIFSIILLFSNVLISALIFIISFLCLLWDHVPILFPGSRDGSLDHVDLRLFFFSNVSI